MKTVKKLDSVANYRPGKMVIVERKGLQTWGDHQFYLRDSYRKGTYRVVTKCKAGYMVTSDIKANSPVDAFRNFKHRAISSIEYISQHGAISMYARVGKKVWASTAFLVDLTVGDINQDLSDTALYDQKQYNAVNAKTWGDKAYVMN